MRKTIQKDDLQNNSSAYLATIGAAILWGSAAIFIKLIGLPASTLSFIRFAFPTILISVVLFRSKTPFPPLHNRVLWLASLGNAARMFLYIKALEYTTLGQGVVICYSSPIFSALFARLFLAEPISTRGATALFLGFSGVIVAYSSNGFALNQQFLGMSLMLGSALIYSLVNVTVKRQLSSFSPQQMIFSQNICGAFLFFPIALYNNVMPSPTQMGLALSYSVLIGYIGFQLYYFGLSRLSVVSTVALTYLEVFVAIGFGVLILSETLSWFVILGGALILAGCFVVSTGGKQPSLSSYDNTIALQN